jgi:hypothetical protein
VLISLKELGGLMTIAAGEPGAVEEEVETAVISQGPEAVVVTTVSSIRQKLSTSSVRVQYLLLGCASFIASS